MWHSLGEAYKTYKLYFSRASAPSRVGSLVCVYQQNTLRHTYVAPLGEVNKAHAQILGLRVMT